MQPKYQLTDPYAGATRYFDDTVKPRYVTPEERAPVTAAALKGIKAVEESASLPALAAKYAYEQLPVEQRAMLETAGRMAGNVGQRIAQSEPMQAAGQALGQAFPNAGKLTNYIGGSPADNPMFNLETGPATAMLPGMWKTLSQEISSLGTSINSAKLPSAFTKIERMNEVKKGDVILDIGGGKFDNAIEWADKQGAKLHVFDPFNRSEEHNAAAIAAAGAGQADKVTINNVLNVIKEPENRLQTLQQANEALKPGGKIYVSVYKSPKGTGQTSSGWQEGRSLGTYLDEVRQVFPDAKLERGMITAEKQLPIEQTLLNSEGRPVHHTEEGVKNFSDWFGGSKVVDEQGSPLIVHHGTYEDFDVFNRKAKAGSRPAHSIDTIGSWFSTEKKSAGAYGPKVKDVYLNIQNPLELTESDLNALMGNLKKEGLSSETIREQAIRDGYDGIRVLGGTDNLSGDAYVAFHPEQIKSATGNTGAFNPTNPSIVKAEGGSVHYADGGIVDRIAKLSRQAQFKVADLAGLGPEVRFATTAPEQYFPKEEQHNQRGDAMRHILLQAQLMQKHGENPAKIISWLHENLALGQGEAEKAMDLYNDELGREIGRTSKSKEEMVNRALQAIESGKAHTLAEGEGGYAEGGLVNTDDDDYGQPFGDEIAKLYQGGLYRKGGEVHKYIVTSLTPVQKKLLKAHHAELGDESSFDDWMSDSGIPAIIHGHATKSMDSFLTPEQREMLDQVNS